MIQNTAELISKQDGLTLSVLWTEPEKKVRGVVQISHGMSEHKERYLPFMKFLAGHGYAAVIHDHRGHGGSVREKEDLGYFYNTKEKGIIEDLHQVTRWAKDRFAGLPFYMLGHSMGTLVARNYLKQYDEELDKLVLTGPPSKNPAVDAGLWLAKVQKKLRGGSYRSKEIQLLAFGPFASRFINSGTVKTNAEGLIGREARVTSEIDNEQGTGSAVVGGQEWTARARDSHEIYPAGTVVRILDIQGVKLIVGTCKEGEE